MGGYSGRCLRVELAGGKIDSFQVPEKAQRAVIGGSGLGAWLFFERARPDVEPLSPENPLLILNGPLAGTGFPGSSRFAVCARSPLTGIWGEAAVGGNFGPALRQAGWDGIEFAGAASAPRTLVIDDGKVELRDASSLWGQDTYETTRALKMELGGEFRIFCIGPAGENRVRYAVIANDGAHFAGRTGLGAVMGAKRLKAVAVRGSGQVPLADARAFAEARKAVLGSCRDSMVARSLHELGTAGGLDLGMMSGDVPIRNWASGRDREYAAALGGPALAEKYLTRTATCLHCPVACKRLATVRDGPFAMEEGPGPEFETLAAFGTMLENRDLAAVLKANELCNRLGLDTISCGATIAFAMECREHGLLSAVGGEAGPSWGDMKAVLALLPKIARREGLGELLAEGSVRAAARLGGEAPEWAMAVKGLELPMHDPRAYHGMGLAYAYSSRGGCHNQHSAYPVEQGIVSWPELGLRDDWRGQSSAGKAEMVAVCENYGLLMNCLCQCHFVNFATRPTQLLAALNAVTGWNLSIAELLVCGERVWQLKRGLANLMGVRDRDDRLPARLLEPLGEGGAAGSAPDLSLMKREYKRIRGLAEDGVAGGEALGRLGLEELAARLQGG
jgi:aldehyde:ferredoxin oxidoreductase